MAKIDYLTAKIVKERDLGEDFFDYLQGPPVSAFFTPYEIDYIKKLILRNRNDVKINMLNAIMKSKGFSRLSAGTNRIVYRYYEDPTFVLKVALDRVGLQNNLDEFRNQNFLKPYVCKIFNTTPDGLMATVERVNPITTKAEFDALLVDVFYIIVGKLIGEMVSDDIGKNYFRNYGVRSGFGPVLLDYPYFYKLDPEKLFCSNVDERGIRCNGLIDYDDGFNHLYCRKCGKRYFALDLEDKNPKNKLVIHKGGKIPMKTSISCNGIVKDSSDIIAPRHRPVMVNRFGGFKASIKVSDHDNVPKKKETLPIIKEELSEEDAKEIPIYKAVETGGNMSMSVPKSELQSFIDEGWSTESPEIETEDEEKESTNPEEGKDPESASDDSKYMDIYKELDDGFFAIKILKEDWFLYKQNGWTYGILAEDTKMSELQKDIILGLLDVDTQIIDKIVTKKTADGFNQTITSYERPKNDDEAEHVFLYKEDGKGGVIEKEVYKKSVPALLKKGWNPNKDFKLLKSAAMVNGAAPKKRSAGGPKIASGAKKKGSTKSNFIPEGE